MKKSRVFGLTLVFFLMNMQVAFLQEPGEVISNENLVRTLVVSKIVKIVNRNIPQGENLFIQINASENLNSWLRTQLTDSLISKTFSIYQKKPNEIPVYQIAIDSPQLDFRYRKKSKRLFFWTRNYGREFQYQFHVTIISPEGKVVASQLIKNGYSDVVPAGKWEVVESKGLPFTRGTKQQSSRFKRVLEPVILTGATMTILYLFYTLRSGK